MEFDVQSFITPIVFSVVFLLAMNFITKRIKPIFRVLDDKIDRFKKIDFSERIHKELENAVSYIMFLCSWAGMFVIWGVEDPLSNKWFLLVATIILLKTLHSFIPAFLKSVIHRLTKVKVDRHMRKLTEKLVVYALNISVCLYLLWLFDFTEWFTALLAGAGFAGIVVGFAAKDVLANLLGGIIVVLDRPFKIGDSIEVQGIIGTVDEIALWSTTIKMFDNKIVTVPNAIMSNNPVINYTRERFRRIDVPVGISYDSDMETAIKVIRSTLKKVDGIVTEDKKIMVMVSGFGESSIDLTARFWVDTRKGFVVIRSAAIEHIRFALDKAGIEIPFPTRVMIQSKTKKSPVKHRKPKKPKKPKKK